ncbi:diadenosine tetraphosphate (Ap4A) HIT family hydrolase [Nitrospirillum amazonense]|uniref:Diadenosine tetraphosphate (Ap4A) HIT family hydrolase n=1 Tax=Nitrospirillum amazonense TaxID=28077 RepID=A0A560F095_9PROT|nr:HIT domain-containing protein [Nitrospirillum amazonense]TWB15046.1 diadenosine tetraphosphate (Ap4A) HIT family hydrolase [Nitrospirillum amazonense]
MTSADDFTLHPRLTADTVAVGDLPLCRALLSRNACWPWLILVPRRVGAVEIHRLTTADQVQLMAEITQASQVMEAAFAPDKLNVAAIGNMVPQLHVHVVARKREDAAWPGPIWGSGHERAYAAGEAEALARRLAVDLGL